MQWPRKTKTILRKNKVGVMSLPDFKTFYKDMVIKIDCYLSKYRQ